MSSPTIHHQVVEQGLRRLDAAGYLEIKQGMVEAWASILSDVPPELLAKAFMQIEGTFKPRFYNERILPPYVREIAMSFVSADWAEAFEECVIAAERMENPIRTTDAEGNLVCAEYFQFSSPLVAKAFHAFGGVNAFKGMQDGDRKIRGPQFRSIYEKAAASIQGSEEGIKALAEHKSNVVQIASARSQLSLQERVEKTRQAMADQQELTEEQKQQADKIMRSFMGLSSDKERRLLTARMIGVKKLDFGPGQNDYDWFTDKGAPNAL